MGLRVVGPGASYLHAYEDGDVFRLLVIQSLVGSGLTEIRLLEDRGDEENETVVPLSLAQTGAEPNRREFTRRGDAEHVIGEAGRLMSRAQVRLAPSPTRDYLSGTILGRITANQQLAHMDLSATDGRQHAAGILYSGRRRSASAQDGVAHIGPQSRHNGRKLIWPPQATGGQKSAIVERLRFLEMLVSF